MTDKQPSSLNALAAEALELWQEHLNSLAADPKAKAELAHILEPSRRLFADWAEKAQNPQHGTASGKPSEETGAVRPAASGSAFDDGLVRLAQLALHVADLEKRVGKLEIRQSRPAAKVANTNRPRRTT